MFFRLSWITLSTMSLNAWLLKPAVLFVTTKNRPSHRERFKPPCACCFRANLPNTPCLKAPKPSPNTTLNKHCVFFVSFLELVFFSFEKNKQKQLKKKKTKKKTGSFHFHSFIKHFAFLFMLFMCCVKNKQFNIN